MRNKDSKKKPVYRFANLTLLELMAVLAVLGVLATWILHRFFE